MQLTSSPKALGQFAQVPPARSPQSATHSETFPTISLGAPVADAGVGSASGCRPSPAARDQRRYCCTWHSSGHRSTRGRRYPPPHAAAWLVGRRLPEGRRPAPLGTTRRRRWGHSGNGGGVEGSRQLPVTGSSPEARPASSRQRWRRSPVSRRPWPDPRASPCRLDLPDEPVVPGRDFPDARLVRVHAGRSDQGRIGTACGRRRPGGRSGQDREAEQKQRDVRGSHRILRW